ncbi:hypothetical protein BJ508DRAFT_419213 [Ascobolus immersus RN42]|uniref:Extracellular membrane protein CFEM domain-containing protein n=1 Tax=Ascobolus immersus RN42 TaxID=1160509 RepID=A0A3N4HLH5_ASCIM|nr:hypothetical protein BJ508DRAFT_419213 [Ascobolus immersus RN42]
MKFTLTTSAVLAALVSTTFAQIDKTAEFATAPVVSQLVPGKLGEILDSLFTTVPLCSLPCIGFHINLASQYPGTVTEDLNRMDPNLEVLEKCGAFEKDGLTEEKQACVCKDIYLSPTEVKNWETCLRNYPAFKKHEVCAFTDAQSKAVEDHVAQLRAQCSLINIKNGNNGPVVDNSTVPDTGNSTTPNNGTVKPGVPGSGDDNEQDSGANGFAISGLVLGLGLITGALSMF